jgi:hypothetical protein
MQQWQFINNVNQLNMFRAIVSFILRSTRLCFNSVWFKHRRCCSWWHVTSLQHRRCTIPQDVQITHSSAPEDGRNYRPKHVELIEVINKLSLLHIVGCLYYCINDARSHKYQIAVSQSVISGTRNAHEVLVRHPKKNRPFVRPGRRWLDIQNGRNAYYAVIKRTEIRSTDFGHTVLSLMSTKHCMMMCPGLIWHRSGFSGSLLGWTRLRCVKVFAYLDQLSDFDELCCIELIFLGLCAVVYRCC